MTGLRIALVEFNPSGGLFQFAFQLGEALAGLGHEVELITGANPELLASTPGFKVTPILPTWHPGAGVESTVVRKLRRGVRAVRHVTAWGVLARHLRSTSPDIVQWAEWRFAVDGAAAALIARRHWARVAIDLAHSPVPLQEQRGGASYKAGPLLSRGLRSGYQAMDSILVLGDDSRRQLLEAWTGVRRVDTIPHGDESALVRRPVPPLSELPLRVVSFGSLTNYKGLDLLVEAFATVRRELPTSELLIAGPLVGDLDLEALRRQADAVGGVDIRVGYVPIDEVVDVVGSSRVVAAPYRRSNASGVVRLAHTMGRPVVVTDVGDLGASVVPEITGLVVPPENPSALADALIRLLKDPVAADRMGQEGRRRLLAEASWPVVAQRASTIYQELLEPLTQKPD